MQDEEVSLVLRESRPGSCIGGEMEMVEVRDAAEGYLVVSCIS